LYLVYIERGNDYNVVEAPFDPECMWFVRPQLFFHCTLRPIGTKAGHGRCNRSDDDIPLDLVFFSAFEELRLQTAERWNRTEFTLIFTRFTSPPLFLLSSSEGLRTSTEEFLSFHAFWKKIQHLLFHISTAADIRSP
jgi:hypothetical protein